MLRHLWWIAGLALVGGGVAIVLSSQAGPTDDGWFAYTPLSGNADWHMSWGDSSSGSVVVASRWQLVGGAIAVLGLVVVAAGTGFRLGRRTR